MFKSNFSYVLLITVLIFCVVVEFSAYQSEESDSAIFFQYPHHHHLHTFRDVFSKKDEDESCHPDGISGKCVEVKRCPPAIQEIRRRKHTFNNSTKPPSNRYSTEPSTDTSERSRLKTRKCVQVCEEYSNEVKPDISFHIIEGEDAEPKEFPHMVAIGYNSENVGEITWGCGGTLISNLYVLTAAHCIVTSDRNPPVKAKMGILKLDDTSGKGLQEFDVADIKIHPDYKRFEKLNDIALIKLNKEVKYSDYVHPACLYVKDDDPLGMVVTGWGNLQHAGNGSNILQKAKLYSVPLRECNITYLSRTTRSIMPTQLCAADNKSDTCQGDSGGPLQVQNIANSSVYSVAGITSYGLGCGSKYPGIYTRVSSYLDWIEGIVWPDS
ncbi:hypothetical protein HHI36_013919 [Cryptolaemus montrouzieri]|uniref:Peptidase S1 domain-containing protein n=1 Tax=Cryptolaemus montrouzieri TaxID=559131 RepID=A0ABD2N158_9CUCU